MTPGNCLPRPSMQGERNPYAKLSELDVDLIRRAKGIVPGARIARLYGISNCLVTLVQQRKRWAHIPVANDDHQD